MIKYFFQRLLYLLPKLIIISVIIFMGMQLIPGDVISRSISPEVYTKLSPTQLEELREKLGLNENLFVQYFKWLFRIFKGDLGYSLSTGGSIRSIIALRLPATLELMTLGFLIATILGLILGFTSAIKQNSILDYSNTILGMVGISIPEFFFGLSFILIFSLKLKWLPTGGRMVMGKEAFFDRLQFLILPAICLGITYIATLMRFTRSSMLEVINKDYIKTARSKGISEIKVNLKHVFRNALIPIMVIIVLRIPIMFSGAVIIENVFNYPGMGSMLVTAINLADMPLVMMSTLIITVSILLASFLVDVLTAMLDPRVRFGGLESGL